jgi:hypothetical protein
VSPPPALPTNPNLPKKSDACPEKMGNDFPAFKTEGQSGMKEKRTTADISGLRKNTISSTTEGSIPILEIRDRGSKSIDVLNEMPESGIVHVIEPADASSILKIALVLSMVTVPVSLKEELNPIFGLWDPTTHTLVESLAHVLTNRTSSSGDACIALLMADEIRNHRSR